LASTNNLAVREGRNSAGSFVLVLVLVLGLSLVSSDEDENEDEDDFGLNRVLNA
jgi:hypothetical protein